MYEPLGYLAFNMAGLGLVAVIATDNPVSEIIRAAIAIYMM